MKVDNESITSESGSEIEYNYYDEDEENDKPATVF